jgi:hypothetical protein
MHLNRFYFLRVPVVFILQFIQQILAVLLPNQPGQDAYHHKQTCLN